MCGFGPGFNAHVQGLGCYDGCGVGMPEVDVECAACGTASVGGVEEVMGEDGYCDVGGAGIEDEVVTGVEEFCAGAVVSYRSGGGVGLDEEL